MGKFSGYDIFIRQPDGKLLRNDWKSSKAGAKREVERAFEIVAKTRGQGVLVLAIDPDNGQVVAGRMGV